MAQRSAGRATAPSAGRERDALLAGKADDRHDVVDVLRHDDGQRADLVDGLVGGVAGERLFVGQNPSAHALLQRVADQFAASRAGCTHPCFPPFRKAIPTAPKERRALQSRHRPCFRRCLPRRRNAARVRKVDGGGVGGVSVERSSWSARPGGAGAHRACPEINCTHFARLRQFARSRARPTSWRRCLLPFFRLTYETCASPLAVIAVSCCCFGPSRSEREPRNNK